MIVTIFSANHEWKAAKSILAPKVISHSPYREFFEFEGQVFAHGGWGKVDSAASCQYFISKWNPKVIFNFGTCGGIDG